jgi:hypothetical protein
MQVSISSKSIVQEIKLEDQVSGLKISWDQQLWEFGGIESLANLLIHNSSVIDLDFER